MICESLKICQERSIFFEPKSAKAELIKKAILNDLKNLSFDTFLYKITEIIRKRKAERA